MKQNTYLSIEEIISIPTLSETTISEDGNKLAYVKRIANWKDNTYNSQVWIYEKDKEQGYSLTTSDINTRHPLWSPDSKYIAYLRLVGTQENKKNQIYVRSIDTKVAVQVTDADEGVIHFKWDPKGGFLLYFSIKRI